MNPQKNFFNTIIPTFLERNSLGFPIFPPTDKFKAFAFFKI